MFLWPSVVLQALWRQQESHRKLWVISKGSLSSGFCPAGPGGTTGREDGDMYSVSSSLSDCSPGRSFGTGSGLGQTEEDQKQVESSENSVNDKIVTLSLTLKATARLSN